MTPVTWTLLPSEALHLLPAADTRAGLSRVIVHADGEGGVRIDAGIAADSPFVEAAFAGWRVQLGLEAAVYMDFDAAGELTFDLQTFDGRFGLPFDARVGPWSARLEVAHLSAHWGDGVRRDGERPENLDAYSREFVQLQVRRELGPASVYAGGRALVHRTPVVDPWAVQLGAEGWAPWTLAPYAAVDVLLAGEFGWTPQVGAQLGVGALGERRRLRIAAVAHLGPDDTGKREGAPERYLGFLVGFDATGGLRPAPVDYPRGTDSSSASSAANTSSVDRGW